MSRNSKKKPKQRPRGLAVARTNVGPPVEDAIPKKSKTTRSKPRNDDGSSAPNLTFTSIDALPQNALASIASYFYKVERALFASALSASSSSWKKCGWKRSPSLASRAVMAGPYWDYSSWNRRHPYEEKWEDLGFDQCSLYGPSASLCEKLDDGDLCGILVCANAIDKLKRLDLPYCLRIVGQGLAPLFGSSVLEEVDLSFVYQHASPEVQPKPSLSEHAVIPILRSIIGAEGSPLKHIQLPKVWRDSQSDLVRSFLGEYNTFLENRMLGCSICDEDCRGTEGYPLVVLDGEQFGLQNMTCQDCKKHFCRGCGRDSLRYCPSCEGKKCTSCAEVLVCQACGQTRCEGCESWDTCQVCKANLCDPCSGRLGYGHETSVYMCEWCERLLCEGCVPRIECKGSCMVGLDGSLSSCKDCSIWRKDSIKQCVHCGQGFCASCKTMERCHELNGDICGMQMDDLVPAITEVQYENAEALMAEFCKVPFLAEFSRPVALLHPELITLYSKIIHHPMDLGHVCRALRRRQYKNTRDIQLDVWRVFSNCIKFHMDPRNRDGAVPSFISISMHLRDYFNALWREYMLPSDAPPRAPGRGISHVHSTFQKRAEARKERLSQVSTYVLSPKCLNKVALALTSFISSGGKVDKLDRDAILGDVANAMGDIATFVTSLRKVIDTLHSRAQDGQEYTVIDLYRNMKKCYTEDVFEHEILKKMKISQRLDRILGKALAPIHEVSCRGVNQSSIWGCMAAAIWARESKKKPYWPAVVLGILAPDYQKEDWHQALTVRNEARLPEKLRDDLKVAKKWAEQGSKRQGADRMSYFLVEFMGSHEFIWVKESDIIENFDPEEDVNVAAAAGNTKKRRSTAFNAKQMSNAIEEGRWALEEFELQLNNTCGDRSDDEEDYYDDEGAGYTYDILCQTDDEADEQADDVKNQESDIEELNELLAGDGLLDFSIEGRKKAKARVAAVKKTEKAKTSKASPKLEYCFELEGDICSECHRSIHRNFECYWRPLPAKLVDLVADYAKELSKERAAEFWRDCVELLWSDKDFDHRIYGDTMKQRKCLLLLVAACLVKGNDIEATYLYLYAMLLYEALERGTSYIKDLLACWDRDLSECAQVLGIYFNGFSFAIDDSRTRKSMVAVLRSGGILRYATDGEKNLLSALLDKVQITDTPIHSISLGVNENDKHREDMQRIYGNSLNMSVTVSNKDDKWDSKEERYVYKDMDFGWWLKCIHAERDFNSLLDDPNASPSNHYFRARWRREGRETTLFVSSAGKKTLWNLGIGDSDELIVGGVAPLEDEDQQCTRQRAVKAGPKKHKKRGGPKKKKQRAKPHSTPPPTEDQLKERYRQEHSETMTPVFEEMEPKLKEIRNHLNNLTLEKSSPKVRHPKRGKSKRPAAAVIPTLPPDDALGGKAGKVAYPILVGEVANLYKTSKYTSVAPITIDLHGCSREEALQKLDESLPLWVDTAMKGEHPWVIPVDIVCGGGSQILSETVQQWIRTHRQVANRPKRS